MRGHPFLLRGAGGLAGGLSAAFVAAVVVQVTAVPAAHGAVPLPHAHDVPSTAGNTVAPQLAPPDPTAAQDMTHPPAATTWPKSGAADVTLPPAPARVRPGPRSPDWMRAGTLPVSVQQLSTGHAGNVHVEVLDHGATVPAARPLVVRIQAAGRVGVQLDYGSFRDAYGGDWAARLHLVRLPECALTTPAAAACQAEDLLTTNDPVTRPV